MGSPMATGRLSIWPTTSLEGPTTQVCKRKVFENIFEILQNIFQGSGDLEQSRAWEPCTGKAGQGIDADNCDLHR